MTHQWDDSKGSTTCTLCHCRADGWRSRETCKGDLAEIDAAFNELAERGEVFVDGQWMPFAEFERRYIFTSRTRRRHERTDRPITEH